MKKYKKFLKPYIKVDKNYKVWWYWNWNEISHNKSPISINNIDVNKIVVSNKVSLSKTSFKSFIDYRDAKTIRPLCIFLIKMSTYRKDW